MPANKVLLVEDDALIQTVLETALTDAGFQVVAAGGGARALAELDAGTARFRALITDVNLGAGPDGWAIGRRARASVPDLPVVYMSGDSGHEWPSKGVPRSVMLAKPFAPTQLVTAVSMLITDTDTRRAG